jgi:hypothetical protein
MAIVQETRERIAYHGVVDGVCNRLSFEQHTFKCVDRNNTAVMMNEDFKSAVSVQSGVVMEVNPRRRHSHPVCQGWQSIVIADPSSTDDKRASRSLARGF